MGLGVLEQRERLVLTVGGGGLRTHGRGFSRENINIYKGKYIDQKGTVLNFALIFQKISHNISC